MKIADSLRQECMPEIIYTICKLVGSKSYKKDEIKSYITLNCDSVQEYNKAFSFANESGFIKIEGDEKVSTAFTKDQLSSFRSFRHAIFMDIFKSEPTMFNSLAKWYLGQNSDVFGIKSAQDLAVKFPKEIFSGKVKDSALGFRFWMVALGLCMFSKTGNSLCLVFETNNAIQDWLEYEKPFKKNTTILAKDFFDKLVSECPVFESCIDGNQINLALSMGLRVLHLNGVIELKYVTDSGDIWHLVESISNPSTNKITEIIVR